MFVEKNLNDPAWIGGYMEDSRNVFGYPDRFGVSAIIAYLHAEDIPVTVDYTHSFQGNIGMSLSRQEIEEILIDLKKKGYVEGSLETGFTATDKLYLALEKDGVTEQNLTKLADVLIQ